MALPQADRESREQREQRLAAGGLAGIIRRFPVLRAWVTPGEGGAAEVARSEFRVKRTEARRAADKANRRLPPERRRRAGFNFVFLFCWDFIVFICLLSDLIVAIH